jgi:hypothetical protein
MFAAVAVVGIAGLLVAPAVAKTSGCQIHVSKKKKEKKANYGDLQSAVNAAAPAATLTVRGDCVGTTEIQKKLTIVGSKAKGFGSPTLDGNQAGSVVKVNPATDPKAVVAISNLTITNGNAQNGGGVSVVGARVTLANVQISDNTARGAGGGLYLNSPLGTPVGTGVTCTHCTITGNKAVYGGGAAIINSTLDLKSSTVQDNTASKDGGGLYVFGGPTPPFPTAARTASTKLRSKPQTGPASNTVCPTGILVLGDTPCPTDLSATSGTTVSNNTAPTGSNASSNNGNVTTDPSSTIAPGGTGYRLYWAGNSVYAPTIKYATVYPDTIGENFFANPDTDVHNPSGVAVDSSHVYWANEGSGTIVWDTPDGNVHNQHTIVTGQNRPVGVAVDSSHLYWANAGDPGQSNGTIMEANLDGSDPHPLFQDQNDPSDVAVANGVLYWSSFDGGTILEANVDGGHVLTVANGQDNPNGVAADFNHLYWANSGDFGQSNGTIVWVGLNGNTPSTPETIATGQAGPAGMAIDSSNIFWANYQGGTIMVANLDGSNQQTLISGESDPNGPAVGPIP